MFRHIWKSTAFIRQYHSIQIFHVYVLVYSGFCWVINVYGVVKKVATLFEHQKYNSEEIWWQVLLFITSKKFLLVANNWMQFSLYFLWVKNEFLYHILSRFFESFLVSSLSYLNYCMSLPSSLDVFASLKCLLFFNLLIFLSFIVLFFSSNLIYLGPTAEMSGIFSNWHMSFAL